MLDFLKSNNYWLDFLWSFLLFVILFGTAELINRIVHKTIGNHPHYYYVRKFLRYVAGILFGLGLVTIWLDQTTNLGTFLGLISAGLAVALRDIFINLAAWIFIMTSRPFRIGDRIQLGQVTGDVVDLRPFQFSLVEVNEDAAGEQSTGRIIDIPNQMVFAHPIHNSIKGFAYVWNDLQVELTYDSDWEKAKEALLEIANRHTLTYVQNAEEEIRRASRDFMIQYNNFTPIIYTNVQPTGIILSIRYLSGPRDKRTIRMLIWEDILRLVKEDPSIQLRHTA